MEEGEKREIRSKRRRMVRCLSDDIYGMGVGLKAGGGDVLNDIGVLT